MQDPYIPPPDADFDVWFLNFSTLITAAPATYALTPTDALAIAAQYTAWHAAFLLATNPTSRTKPSVADKDAARAAALGVVRPYAIGIRNNAGISNMDKLDLGVNVPDFTPTPVPPPSSNPTLIFVAATPNQHTLQYRDALTPLLRKKPFGAVALQLFRAIGTVPAVSPAACSWYGNFTKVPVQVAFDSADAGKVATYFGRWITRSGPHGVAQPGPWSPQLTAFIV